MPDRLFVRKLPPILLCLFALLLVGCGATSPGPNNSNLTPAPADKQVLRYPIGAADFGTLDPARAMLDIDNFTIQMIFTGLVELKSDGTLIDQMAASHQISADGLTYTFKLKPNLKFSDGSPITAEDIAYSINRVLSPETKSPTSSLLEPIKDSDKILAGKIPTLIGDSLLVKDLQTISIALSSPAAYFLQALSGPEAFTVNKRLIEKYGSKWTDHLAEGAGSGPFQAQAYDHNTGLTLVPNPNYSGPQSKLQKIEMLRSGDVDTTYKTYQTGQLDYTTVPTIQLASAKQRKDFHQVPILQMTAITMNFLAKPFNNVKIRQAFALAVNKDLLAENVMHGATAPTNHILPLGMPGYNKAFTGVAGVSSTRGDASKAKQLLQEGMQEEGYASVNQLPPITFTYIADDSDLANIAAVLVQQWQAVLGVTVKASVATYQVLIQERLNTIGNSGPLQIWMLQFGNYADPQGWLSFYYGKGASYNTLNYGLSKGKLGAAQQAVQQELQQADTNLNPQQRTQQYNDAELKLANDVAWLPLFQTELQVLVNPKLQNFPLSPVGLIEPDAWSKMYFVQ